MARVHLLDDELINKIAAGEVVERPASVVKELVENAIDAGATHIKVSLKDGGRQLIQVSDDGLGMDPEDAELALRRHTTSKLRKSEDLFQVTTMGFRGEALASISSVSRFSLQTQAKGQEQGVRIVIEDGQQQRVPWSGSVGTTISVADLFFNVPARKAFMKTGAAEFAACHEYMQALALSLPQIGFTLLHNDREILHVSPLPAGEAWPRGEQVLRRRVAAIFGEDTTKTLLYVMRNDRYARIEGLISAPGQDKGSAKQIFHFVNNRWVRDKLLRFGIMRGYHSHLLKGKFPVAFLHCDIDPALVDVNVHPAKAELRFQYANEVQNTLAMTIREALRQGAWSEAPLALDTQAATVRTHPPRSEPAAKVQDHLPADFDLMLGDQSEQVPVANTGTPAVQRSGGTSSAIENLPLPPLNALRSSPSSHRSSERSQRSTTVTRTTMSFDGSGNETRAYEAAPPRSTLPIETPTMSPELNPTTGHSVNLVGETIPWDELEFMGAFARCYLFFEHRGQMLVIDQHAFHERVLYERLLQNPKILHVTQPLLMPEVLEFSPSEVVELERKKANLADCGLRFERVSDSEIEVQAVPSLLMNKDLAALFHGLLNGAENGSELAHDTLSTLACHAAVRAGEELPEAELKTLLREARTVDFYHNCPHGRRVFRWWKMSQVAAWFDRLG